MQPAVKNLDLVLRVVAHVRENVGNGVYKAGERLYEAQLARDLGMSRTPVREAARLLESEGLLTSEPNRGFLVRKMSVRDFIDVSEFRIVIERQAIRMICESSKRARITQLLHARLDDILLAAKEGSTAAQIKADTEFHRTLVVAAGNGSMLKAYDNLTRDLQLAFRMMRESTTDWNAICESHRPVLQAVTTGTADAAAEAIERHLKLAWDETLEELSATMDAPFIG